MQFSLINGATFTVAIWPRPLFVDGQPAKAKIDYVGRRILISDQLARDERRRALFHELRHCWVQTRGRVSGAEADAIDVAELMDTILDAYTEQGGDDVLLAMHPEPETAPKVRNMAEGPLGQNWAQCGGCRQSVMIGSIHTTPPTWHPSAGVWIVERSMHCDRCEKITAWSEVSDQAGVPQGGIIAHPPPRVLRGEDARRWYAEHADLCDVICR